MIKISPRMNADERGLLFKGKSQKRIS